ncbi:MAG: hypothetical protein KIH89_000515 [Candidatus Shapirobacteria bacterium]|nr:hypothetical protein [Candidatus Shapirobacteria bacterium]
MKIKAVQRGTIILYSLSVLWWLAIFARGVKETTENYLFNIPMAVIPILAGVYTLFVFFKHKESYTRYLRLAIIFCSLALVSWGFGNIVYLYFNFHLNNPIPYKQFPDIFYAAGSTLWIAGLFFLVSSTGHKKMLYYLGRRAIIFCLVLLCFAETTYIFLADKIEWTNLTKDYYFGAFYTVLDLVVFFQLCALLYLILMRRELRGMQKTLFIFLGFCFNYVADVAYIIFAKEFFVASWIDFVFFTGAFFQGLGLLALLEMKSKKEQL